MADKKTQLNIFDAYREMMSESNEKIKQNSIAITHSIQKARKLVAVILNKVGVSDYYYSSANQNGGKHSAFSVKWTDAQKQEFNKILDQLQAKNPEVAAIEIY